MSRVEVSVYQTHKTASLTLDVTIVQMIFLLFLFSILNNEMMLMMYASLSSFFLHIYIICGEICCQTFSLYIAYMSILSTHSP